MSSASMNPALVEGVTAGGEPLRLRGSVIRTAMLPLVLGLIFIFFSFSEGRYRLLFVSPENISNLAIELSVTAVLALGMLLVILPGHLDLSAGSGVGMVGGAAAVLIIQHGWPALPAMAVSAAGAIVIWLLMGTLIVKQRMPAFIVTLGGLLIFRGVLWKIIQSHTVPVVQGGQENLYSFLTTYRFTPTAGLVIAAVVIVAMGLAAARAQARMTRTGAVSVQGKELAFLRTFVTAQVILLFVLLCNEHRGVPLPAVILGAVALAVHTLIRHTPYGRYLYAIGGNEEASLISGVPVSRVTIYAFGIMGALVALTGFLRTAYQGSSTTTVGELMELDAVAACVIGGVSLRGGRGTVGGVLLGSLIMASLLNGMTLLAYSPETKFIVRGAVLTLAVWADVRLGRKST